MNDDLVLFVAGLGGGTGTSTIVKAIEDFHDMPTQGGTSVVMDSQDLKRALTEHKGCLVLSKQELASVQVESAADVTTLFKKAIESSDMHEAVNLVDGNEVTKVHHVGLLASLDSKKDYGNGSFIESATEHMHDLLPINGTVFSGYVQEKNEGMVAAYAFYKADVLPGRLAKGLVEEYKEFMERNKKVKYATSSI